MIDKLFVVSIVTLCVILYIIAKNDDDNTSGSTS